jgi:hypothetical protein
LAFTHPPPPLPWFLRWVIIWRWSGGGGRGAGRVAVK